MLHSPPNLSLKEARQLSARYRLRVLSECHIQGPAEWPQRGRGWDVAEVGIRLGHFRLRAVCGGFSRSRKDLGLTLLWY